MSEEFARYLAGVVTGRMTLADFQDWFIDYVMGPAAVRPEDIAISADIENAMAEFSGGHISEQDFRAALLQHLVDAPIISYLGYSPPQMSWSSSANRTVRSERLVVNA